MSGLDLFDEKIHLDHNLVLILEKELGCTYVKARINLECIGRIGRASLKRQSPKNLSLQRSIAEKSIAETSIAVLEICNRTPFFSRAAQGLFCWLSIYYLFERGYKLFLYIKVWSHRLFLKYLL